MLIKFHNFVLPLSNSLIDYSSAFILSNIQHDIYLIYNNEYTSLNKENFCKAAQKTFKKRDFNGNFKNGLEIIKNSEILAKYWDAYVRKNKFASTITFEDTIKCLEVFVDILTSSEK